MTELLPVDAVLALGGRCWSCQQTFDGELYYVLVGTWATCVSCAHATSDGPTISTSGVVGPH